MCRDEYISLVISVYWDDGWVEFAGEGGRSGWDGMGWERVGREGCRKENKGEGSNTDNNMYLSTSTIPTHANNEEKRKKETDGRLTDTDAGISGDSREKKKSRAEERGRGTLRRFIFWGGRDQVGGANRLGIPPSGVLEEFVEAAEGGLIGPSGSASE